jgi:hypothetical protein
MRCILLSMAVSEGYYAEHDKNTEFRVVLTIRSNENENWFLVFFNDMKT